MASSSVGNDPLQLLMERYPEIGFHLTFTPITQRNEVIFPDLHKWQQRLDLEGVDVLYVYGLGAGCYYQILKTWLHARRDRALIFIEDDLSAIAACLNVENSAELMRDPQAHLRFVAHPRQWKPVLEELAQTFPSDKIEFIASATYAAADKGRFSKIRLQLLRNTSAIHALLSEALHYHRLFGNLAANFRYLSEAFYANAWAGKFAGIPAIICGAGPSLADSIETLKTLGDRALIIAGGSAITALTARGVEPHLAVALDPNFEEYLRLKPSTAFATPLLYANRVQPHIFTTCNGALGYMRSDTGGTGETWMEAMLQLEGEAIGPDLGREAFSVTTLNVSLAYHLGCDPIILNGVDLAYTGMQRYAAGVMASAHVLLEDMKKEKRATERLLRRKDRTGKSVHTLVKWVMESACIGKYAKAHPERTFLNSTSGGIGFPGIPFHPLDVVAEKYCSRAYDLRGQIHCAMQGSRLQITPDQLGKILKDLRDSLGRCAKICDDMLLELEQLHPTSGTLESGRMVILQVDFEEEPAFECMLQSAGPAIDRIMQRCYPLPLDTAAPEYRQHSLARGKEKWRQLKTVVEAHLMHIL